MNMNFSTYLKLQLKKSSKLLPTIILITAIILASIATVAFILLKNTMDDEDKQIAKIGLVGNVQDSYLNFGIESIQAFDESREYLQFITMSEEEAIEALKSKDILAYVIFPEDFIHDILWGKNTPARFVYMDGPRSIGATLMQEIVKEASSFVTRSQTAMYTLSDAMESLDRSERRMDKITEMNINYIDFIIHRDRAFDQTYIGLSDGLSYSSYYICGLILFFLLIWGISCNKLLSGKNYELSRLMYRRGLNERKQVLCGHLNFFLVTMAILLIIAFIAGIAIMFYGEKVSVLSEINFLSPIFFVIKAAPAVAMIAMMHILLYEIFTDPIGSLLAQFLISVGLGYISGCFYPISFFPKSVQAISSVLPSGVAFSYLKKIMTGSNILAELAFCLIYALAFYVITVAVRKVRITGEAQ